MAMHRSPSRAVPARAATLAALALLLAAQAFDADADERLLVARVEAPGAAAAATNRPDPATAATRALRPGSADLTNPAQFQCVGRNRFSGVVSVPVEKQGETSDWAYAAFFTDPVQGTPVIVYGPRFRAMPPLLQAFVRRHECQHANGIQDEVAANCLALAQMRAQGLTPDQEAVLERWHMAEGPLDPQYGGSGAAFWERTLRCAAAVR